MHGLFSTARGGPRLGWRTARTGVRVALSAALMASALGVFSGTAVAATTTGSKTFSNTTARAIPDDAPVTDPQFGQTFSTIAVSGLSGTVTNVTVSFYVTSNRVSQLAAGLLDPSFAFDPITGQPTGFAGLLAFLPATGDNLGTGCASGSRMAFDDAAPAPASSGTSPYVGTFQPDPNQLAPLSRLNGIDPNGNWQLLFQDNAPDGVSALQCWSVTITTTDNAATTFNNDTVTPLAVTLNGGGGPGVANSPVEVSGLKGVITDVSVTVWISHPSDSDLEVALVDPKGDKVTLARGAGGSGANFGTSCTAGKGATTFTDSATTWIMQGQAPFAGSYLPYQSLSGLTGLAASGLNGTWSLRATDSVQGNTGTIQCWSMTVKTASGTTNGLTVVPGLGYVRPLPGTLPDAYMFVRNWTTQPIANVTLTSTLPVELTHDQTGPDYFPGCTVSGSTLTCHFDSVPAGGQVIGGAFGVLGNPKSGKVCISGTATASGQTTSTNKACFYLDQYPSTDSGTGYAVGDTAHDLTLPDQNDVLTSLSQFRGRWVLLQFGAVWCGPSNLGAKQDRDEIQALNAAGTMGAPVEFVQALVDGPTPGVPSTLQNAHVWSVQFATDTPVLYTSGDITKVASQQASTYSFFGGGLPATPTSVWIKPDGTIASIRLGYGAPGDTTQRFLNALP